MDKKNTSVENFKSIEVNKKKLKKSLVNLKRRQIKPKSELAIVVVMLILGLGGLGIYLFNNINSLIPQKPQIIKEENKDHKVSEGKQTALKETIAPVISEAENNRTINFEEKVLSSAELEDIVKSYDQVEGVHRPLDLKHDLSHFTSLRSENIPKSTKAAQNLKINNYETELKPFFEQYCIECHGPEKQKGGMRIDHLTHKLMNPGDVQHWQDVLDTLNGAQMPPKKSAQPQVKETSAIIREISDSLDIARIHFASQKGVSVLRRLNRREYSNTVEDLLGVKVNMDAIPEDNLYNGFDTIGETLTISPFQVRQYFKAAERAIGKYFKNLNKPQAIIYSVVSSDAFHLK